MVTAAQMELPFARAPKTAARPASYVVEINECGIFASRVGVEFWTTQILGRPIGKRLVWLFISPGGGLAQLPCADKEEAEFVYSMLLEHGIHRTHANVKRVPGAAGATP